MAGINRTPLDRYLSSELNPDSKAVQYLREKMEGNNKFCLTDQERNEIFDEYVDLELELDPGGEVNQSEVDRLAGNIINRIRQFIPECGNCSRSGNCELEDEINASK